MSMEQQAYGGLTYPAETYAEQVHAADIYSAATAPAARGQAEEAPSAEIDALMARGISAAVGLGRAPDRIEAHCWFNIAAARGSRYAMRMRQELAQEMTPDEIAHAQRRARAYLAPKSSAAA